MSRQTTINGEAAHRHFWTVSIAFLIVFASFCFKYREKNDLVAVPKANFDDHSLETVGLAQYQQLALDELTFWLRFESDALDASSVPGADADLAAARSAGRLPLRGLTLKEVGAANDLKKAQVLQWSCHLAVLDLVDGLEATARGQTLEPFDRTFAKRHIAECEDAFPARLNGKTSRETQASRP